MPVLDIHTTVSILSKKVWKRSDFLNTCNIMKLYTTMKYIQLYAYVKIRLIFLKNNPQVEQCLVLYRSAALRDFV